MAAVENLRAAGAGHELSARLEEREQAAAAGDSRYADMVRQDVDTFADWLCGECIGATTEDVGRLPRDWRDIDYSIKTNARLLAYALAEGASKEMIGMAVGELVGRYLRERGVRA